MEKIFSDEEKLIRAMEISQRRNGYYNSNVSTRRVNVVNNKRDYKLFKKMILQIIICLLIYIIFHLINTTNYAFSEDVIKSTNNILNYDINLEQLYKNCKNFFITSFNNNSNNESIIENQALNNVVSKNTYNNLENLVITNKIENNLVINGKEENEKDNIKENNEVIDGGDKKEKVSTSKKSAMELDAEKVLKLCKFKKPLSGTITSEFGEREATIKGMTTDHKGIDIAANSGTNIKAAMEGMVSVAGENSEYGKFIKIVNGDVMTVYAHCKALKVKSGEKIKLGQTIATVGSTGNSTGPHLHFEIRLENRYINPKLVIEF